jgi:Spy/CpxP family protein refolding chaperone
MKRFLMASALAGALALTGFIWTAAHARALWAESSGGGFWARHLLNDLNLTPAQRTRIKSILQRERPALQAEFARIDQQDARLREGTHDEAAVRMLAQQQGAYIAEAIVEREKIRAQVFAVLTPEQRRIFNRLRGEFRSTLEYRIAHLGDQL